VCLYVCDDVVLGVYTGECVFVAGCVICRCLVGSVVDMI
jgi:hypothetical protein